MNTKLVYRLILHIALLVLSFGVLAYPCVSQASPLVQTNPVITSVTLNQNVITDGGQIILTIRVQSVSPVDWLNLRLDGPNGILFGGGSSQIFTEISPGIWETTRTQTISEWAPSGTYTYSNLSVRNEQELKSANWPPITFIVNNTNPAQVPVIQSAELNTDTIVDGGELILTIRVNSNAPVDWLNLRLDGPNGILFGGGSSQIFTEISPGVWETTQTRTISEWAPSGTYTYSNLSVRNEGELESADWPPITFIVNNTNPAQVPVIQSAELNTDTIVDGGELILTIRVNSNAPVDWLNLRLDGPNGILFGGGSSQIFTEISPGVWETTQTRTISEWAPSGTYTYSNLSVRNEGELESADWPPITFTVKNGAEAIIDVTTGGILNYTNSDGYLTQINIPSGAVSQTTKLQYMPIQSVTPPLGYNLIGRHKFLLTAYQDDVFQPDFIFLKPITITINYNEDDLGGIDEDSLVLNWKNGEVWEDVVNTCIPSSTYVRNTVDNWLKVSICHLTEFAVFGETKLFFLPVIVKNGFID